MVHAKHLLASFVLAFLVALSGCSQVPSGLDLTLTFNLDPIGVGISIKKPAQITAAGPTGFAVGTPSTAPATQP